jgi:hypothetical protein
VSNSGWIASIFLVLNLVKLAGTALPCQIDKVIKRFSASWFSESEICSGFFLPRQGLSYSERLQPVRIKLKIDY